MANILSAFRRTTTDALSTISATTGALTHGAESIAAFTESASLRAQAYRDATAAEIAENAGKRQIYRVNAAKLEVSRSLLELKRELDQDPELAAIFDEMDDSMFSSKNPALRVAAE